VYVFEGGLVEIPHGHRITPDVLKNFKLPRNWNFACLAETALLALEGYQSNFSLDRISVENVRYISGLAQKHGFRTAPYKNSLGYIGDEWINQFCRDQSSARAESPQSA
jgi:fatty aldehyde-generating acyl-ACP reductase